MSTRRPPGFDYQKIEQAAYQAGTACVRMLEEKRPDEALRLFTECAARCAELTRLAKEKGASAPEGRVAEDVTMFCERLARLMREHGIAVD